MAKWIVASQIGLPAFVVSRFENSQCFLCVLRVSAVSLFFEVIHHRDTENTEEALRKSEIKTSPAAFVVLTIHDARLELTFADYGVRGDVAEWLKAAVC